MIVDIKTAMVALRTAWPSIKSEVRRVQAGELHYQAMIYHALRVAGGVPLSQVGMNVKQKVPNPVSALFRELDLRKSEDYRGGFEPIPDVVIFHPDVGSDWRRRNNLETLKHMLVAIEVKASERKNGRLRPKEISDDILKLSAHREEVQHLGSDMHPVMMVIDVASNMHERMTPYALHSVQNVARVHDVEFMYVSAGSDD